MKTAAVATFATILALVSLGSTHDTAYESSEAMAYSEPTPVNNTVAPIISVTVGADSQLLFDPPFINGVGRGQRIHFDFRALNHTLTESSFEMPCTKTPDAQFDTDFNNANPDDIPNFKPFDITLDSDKPRYFYCKQGNKTPKSHCAKGMVFAVNVDQYKFDSFVQNAAVDGLPKIKGRTPQLDTE